MDKYHSSSVVFVPKPSADLWSSVKTPPNNRSKYNNVYHKPTYPVDIHLQSSRNPWIPKNNNQKERPLSIISFKYNDLPQDYHLKKTNVKHTKSNMKWSKIFKICLVMGIILLTLTATVISIYSLVDTKIGTMTTTTTTMSSTTSTTMTTTTTTTVAVLPSQCYSYAFINDASRLATAAGSTYTDTSVFGTTYAWYQFYGSGGTDIITSAPSYQRCGTYYSGWYASTLPTYGNTVTGTVCYVFTNICYWSNTILVTNCGSFNVYALIAPPIAYARYCTV